MPLILEIKKMKRGIMRIPSIVPSYNQKKTAFKSRLIVDKNPYVQREFESLPQTAKNGIELARRILAKNGNDRNVTLFCANDMVGYQSYPNYWALESEYPFQGNIYHAKQMEEVGYDFESFYKNKTSKQVAKMILNASKTIVGLL